MESEQPKVEPEKPKKEVIEAEKPKKEVIEAGKPKKEVKLDTPPQAPSAPKTQKADQAPAASPIENIVNPADEVIGMDDELLHLEHLDMDSLKQIPRTLRQSFDQVLREV